MHDLVLFLHSWVRWAAIITGVLATVSVLGATADARNNRWAKFFTISLDIQFLLGLILVATTVNFGQMGEVMKDSTARFYAVEHPTMMILGLVGVHAGQVLTKRGARHGAVLAVYGLTLLVLLAGSFRHA